jgi:hypothetical protein
LQRRTVYLWCNRFEEEGLLRNHVSFGRPRKTSFETDGHLVERVRNGGFIRVPDLAQEYNVSPATIRRRLHDAGLHHRCPARKPFLTPRQKIQRVNWVNRHKHHDFSKVIFVDEKTFVTSQDGRVSLWRPNNTRYLEQNVLPNRSSGRLSLNFWGWMSAAGPGELVEVSTRLNSAVYIYILSVVLVPSAAVVYGEETPIEFVQDGCSVHRSRIVQAWIDRQELLRELALPPKSPDLNPIKNLWAMMVQEWDSSQVRDRESLRQHVHELWDSFRGSSLCTNLVNSMPERLETVDNAEGGYTKY